MANRLQLNFFLVVSMVLLFCTLFKKDGGRQLIAAPGLREILLLLESADGYVGTFLNLVEGHVGQAGITIGVK